MRHHFEEMKMTYEITEDQKTAHGLTGSIKEAAEQLDEITSNEMAVEDWDKIERLAIDIIEAAQELRNFNC